MSCHVSHVTCQVSHVGCYMSHVIISSSPFFSFYGQSGEANRWRVCYQWVLPRLVISMSTVLIVFSL